MNFPATRAQLDQAGYRFEFARRCKRCNSPLEFYRTPTKALAPLEPVLIGGAWLMASHFARCPFAEEFRKASPAPPAETKQGKLF